MTKAAEMILLDQFIKRLGPDSYLGPWLLENYVAIDQSLKSDHYPTIQLPRDAEQQAQQIIADAKAQADAILRNANAKAEAHLARTSTDIGIIKDQAIRQIQGVR